MTSLTLLLKEEEERAEEIFPPRVKLRNTLKLPIIFSCPHTQGGVL